MDPMIGWLTSMFGQNAPSVAASMGVPPPEMSFAGAGAPQVSPDFPSAPPDGNVWEPASAAPAAASPGGANALTGALRGMAAPTVPAAQKVSTPAAPRMPDIKGGELLAMLLATADGGVPGGRKINPLPGTLGQALNVPRY